MYVNNWIFVVCHQDTSKGNQSLIAWTSIVLVGCDYNLRKFIVFCETKQNFPRFS